MNNMFLNNPQAQMLLMMMQQIMQGQQNQFSYQQNNFRSGSQQRRYNHFSNRGSYGFRRQNYPQQRRPMRMMQPPPVRNQQQQQQQQQVRYASTIRPQIQQPVIPKPQVQPKPIQPKQRTIQQLLQKWEFLQKIEKPKQRNVLGEVIYPIVVKINSKFAPKITGMLIDLDKNELKHCLLNQELLYQKIHEAAKMLQGREMQVDMKKQIQG